jgi:tetratricopeptide (TPR) repeat protein
VSSSDNKLSKRRALEKAAFAMGDFKEFDKEGYLKAYAARILQNDYKMASALELIEEFPLIEKIKNKLSVGELTEAAKMLSEIKTKLSEEDDLGEVKLESCRLAFFEGNFEESIKEGSECIRLSLSGPTKIAAYQVRANAFFEIGKFDQCLSDLENVSLLAKLYPFSPVIFYADTAKIRLWARTRSPEYAMQKLKNLFIQRQRIGQINLDTLLTYLRVKIDILRLQKEDFYSEAAACFLIANSMGDKLYTGLALLDIWTSVNASQRKILTPNLEIARREFSRIERFAREAENTSKSKCVLSQGINEFVNAKIKLPNRVNIHSVIDGQFDCIFIREQSLWVNLKKQKLYFMPIRPQITSAIDILKKGPITKEKFFKKLWSQNEFHSLNHDNLIRTLLTRVRTETKLNIVSRFGEIHLIDEVIVI